MGGSVTLCLTPPPQSPAQGEKNSVDWGDLNLVLPSFAPAEDGLLAGVLLAHAQPDEQACLLVLLLLLDGPIRFVLQLPPCLRTRRRLQAQLLFDHLNGEPGLSTRGLHPAPLASHHGKPVPVEAWFP